MLQIVKVLPESLKDRKVGVLYILGGVAVLDHRVRFLFEILLFFKIIVVRIFRE